MSAARWETPGRRAQVDAVKSGTRNNALVTKQLRAECLAAIALIPDAVKRSEARLWLNYRNRRAMDVERMIERLRAEYGKGDES